MAKGCPDWEARIEQYHDGELSRRARSKVDAHLEFCEGCRAYLESLESMAEAVVLPTEAALESVNLDSVWARIAPQLERQERLSWTERLSAWFEEFWAANQRLMVASAAAACVAVVIAGAVWRDGGGPAGENPSPGAAAAPTVAVNEVIVDSLQSGEHDMVLVNVHPEDMTTVIWLLEDEDEDEDEDRGADPEEGTPEQGTATAPQPSALGEAPAAAADAANTAAGPGAEAAPREAGPKGHGELAPSPAGE